MEYVTGDIGDRDYVLFTSDRGAVGVVHRSRVGWFRVVTGIRSGVFLGSFRYVGWNRRAVIRYGSIFVRGS